MEYVSEMTNNERIQIPPPSRRDLIDLMEEAFNYISSDANMVKRSFVVCGIPQTHQRSEVDHFTRPVWKMRANTFKMTRSKKMVTHLYCYYAYICWKKKQ